MSDFESIKLSSKKSRPPAVRWFVRLHILLYSLLAILWAMGYFKSEKGEGALAKVGFSLEQRRAKVVPMVEKPAVLRENADK